MNLSITDGGEISIEMIPVTDSPWISPMAVTQMFMFTEPARESGKGRWWKTERVGEHMWYREIIREVRLGRIRKPGQGNWRTY